MRTFPRFALLLGLAGVFPYPARAETISLSDFPATIQSCWGINCFAAFGSAYDSGSVAAWQMIEWDGPSIQTAWLVRYELGSLSGTESYWPTEFTPYDGYLWMRVQNEYSAGDSSHALTLFLDHVSPAPESQNWLDTTPDLHLFLTSEDLVAGHSYAVYAHPGYGDTPAAGSLSGDLPLICLAEGCETRASLNLVQLTYALSGTRISMSGFDPSDTRNLVYSQGTYYYDYDSETGPSWVTQSFSVTAVPEPASRWLFSVGLLPVLAIAKRRRSRR